MTPSESTSALHRPDVHRSAKAFRSPREHRGYWILFSLLLALALFFAMGLLLYNNPVPASSPSFLPVVRRRIFALLSMAIAALCQSMATVAFQTVTNNRIITPSLLGFDALYGAIHTATIFFFGAGALVHFSGQGAFLFQISVMILFSLLLYGTLFQGKYRNLQLMLLIGIIIGTGLRSVSSFMRRVLSPSEFDVLQAKLLASVNNGDSSLFVIAVPLVILCALLLFASCHRLNALSLGEDAAITLGRNTRRDTLFILGLVSILMAVSTALLGSLTFYGFLVAHLSYRIVKTFHHRYIFLMALVVAFLVITSAYFLMYHVFAAQGVVSIIIEMVGGLLFLSMLLRKNES